MKATLRKQLRAERLALRSRTIGIALSAWPLALLSADRRYRTRRVRDFSSARTLDPHPPQWLDLIVVPLAGVDAEGRRLGMGRGYYDRALAFRRRRRYWKGPHLAGLAFDCQRTNVKFADAWDLRLDSLATETGMEHFL
jgi:5-formyltetrahydrofolate cyclo-ligase